MNDVDIRWLHLSDFHLGKDDYGQRRILEYILEEVDATIRDSGKPDFVFITGDLADKGLASEFKQFETEFLLPLMDKLGDSYANRVFLVPGNHDVDRKKARGAKRYDVLDEVQTFLDPTADGREEREHLLQRFRAFDEYPWYLEQQKWVSSNDGFYARKVRQGTGEVGVLCVNTSWFCGAEKEQGKLSLGLGMLEQGLRELHGADQVFVLGHHPIDWLDATSAHRLLACLAKAGAIYLYFVASFGVARRRFRAIRRFDSVTRVRRWWRLHTLLTMVSALAAVQK